MHRSLKKFANEVDAVYEYYPHYFNEEIGNQLNKALSIANEEFAKHKNTKYWLVEYTDEEGDTIKLRDTSNNKEILLGGSLLLLSEALAYTSPKQPRVIRLVIMLLRRINYELGGRGPAVL